VRVEVGVPLGVSVDEGVGDGLMVAEGLAVSVAEGVAVGGARVGVEVGTGEAVAVAGGDRVESKAPGAHEAERLTSASFRKSRRESLLITKRNPVSRF
jgi:hypothetical protein